MSNRHLRVLFVWGMSLAPVLGAGPDEKALADARGRIDAIDTRIVSLLNERAKIVLEIGRIKQQMNMPVRAPRRVEEVLGKVAQQNQGPLTPQAVKRIYERIIVEMTALESAEMHKGPRSNPE